MATFYPKDFTDEQREIIGRAMKPNRIDDWAQDIFDRFPDDDAKGRVEAKIAIFADSLSPLPYDEMRRRAYPNIGDQLDDLYRSGAFSDDMAATLQAVKDGNPKS